MKLSPRLIFMMGLPGSGKTFLATHLSNTQNLIHISSDKVRKSLHKNKQYSKTAKQEVYLEMQKQMVSALRQNRDVVIDATFYLQEIRVAFETVAKDYTMAIFWVMVMADEETIKERVSIERADSEADFEVYQLIREKFEPLTKSFLTIDTSKISVEDNLNRILHYCQFNPR